jgi:hydrogenase-4 component B
VSEWLVYLGLFDASSGRGAAAFASAAAIVLLAMTGAMALACFTKACGITFLGAPRSEAAARAHESGPLMLAPMLVLGCLCAAIGLAPVLFWPAIARAACAWNPAWSATQYPASLAAIGGSNLVLALGGAAAAFLLWRRVRETGLRRALTWDCGYAAPTARMQYTAGSFAGIITEWFAWILDPRVRRDCPDEPFPSRASFEEHTPEVVLERVVEPAGAIVMGLAAAARRLQHGRLQAYLLYIVVGLVALAAIAAMGGGL